MKKSLYLLILVIVVIGGIVWYSKAYAPLSIKTEPTTSVVATSDYLCEGGKTISATYTDKDVSIILSDGRKIDLPQTISGSGIRYEAGAGTAQDVVFSSKGANAFLTENGATTYDNCVANSASDPSGDMKTFTDQGKTFSFAYPNEVTISGGGVGYTTDWIVNNNAQTLGLVLAKVSLDRSLEPKTNFSGATISVDTSADPAAVSSCLLASNGGVTAKDPVVINGVTYAKITSNDAGAGNFYSTTSYRTVRNNQCYVVEYTVHSTNIGNYSPDQGITQFDEQKINTILEQVVQSFKFL